MQGTELDPRTQTRFVGYLEQIGGTLRDKRQRASFAAYASGLLSDGERKSMEPIAARATGDPDQVSAAHQRLLHFVGSSAWKDAPVRTIAARYAVDELERHEPITTWVVDDTGFLKQGKHSPGVQRQYTGSAGKKANCQIGVSLVLANNHGEVPIDFKLYIPEVWAGDRPRCRAAHIPDDVGYAPKWQLALDMIESACKVDLPRGVVLADSAYGHVGEFRKKLTELGLEYAVDVKCNTTVRRIGTRARVGKRMSVQEIALRYKSKFAEVTWRQGAKGPVRSHFLRMRVLVGNEVNGQRPSSQWLLIEWPKGSGSPSNYVLCTVPETTPLKELLNIAGNRWRVERSYQDLKGQLGLDHYEGRSFIGWHHHITVALVCYAFLAAERLRAFSPRPFRAGADSSLERAA